MRKGGGCRFPARNRSEGDETPDGLLPSYTPKQRETLFKGFRILARVAARAHMERQSPRTASDDGEEEQGDGFRFKPHRSICPG